MISSSVNVAQRAQSRRLRLQDLTYAEMALRFLERSAGLDMDVGVDNVFDAFCPAERD